MADVAEPETRRRTFAVGRLTRSRRVVRELEEPPSRHPRRWTRADRTPTRDEQLRLRLLP